jgi:hypothetical protein
MHMRIIEAIPYISLRSSLLKRNCQEFGVSCHLRSFFAISRYFKRDVTFLMILRKKRLICASLRGTVHDIMKLTGVPFDDGLYDSYSHFYIKCIRGHIQTYTDIILKDGNLSLSYMYIKSCVRGRTRY